MKMIRVVGLVLLCLALTFGAVSCNNDTDTDHLTISTVTAADVTSSGVVITWATNEGATSQVWYGTSDNYGLSSTLDSTLVTTHTVSLAGLTDGTMYHYLVRSEDAAGDVASSNDQTFNTLLSTPAILSHTSSRNNRVYSVVGELQNTSSNKLSGVKVTATFYNSSATVVSTQTGHTFIFTLLPDQKSPFVISEVNEDIAAQVDHYSLAVNGFAVTQVEPYRAFTILSQSVGKNIFDGSYEVTGEVKNTGTQDATYVEVIGTFYDAAGKMVGFNTDYLYMLPLAVGQRTTFKVSWGDDTQIASYELQVTAMNL
jgi:hypothetical protein